ncbi:hypothetical protein ACUH94_07630 [Dermabacteraceae bacterium P7074]
MHNETAPDATFAQVVEVVADPEEEWSANLGHSNHFLRGELWVQVRRADNTVLAVFSRGYALAVWPDIAAMDEAARTAHRDGLSRRPSGASRPLPDGRKRTIALAAGRRIPGE